jgi:hypothetical protein
MGADVSDVYVLTSCDVFIMPAITVLLSVVCGTMIFLCSAVMCASPLAQQGIFRALQRGRTVDALWFTLQTRSRVSHPRLLRSTPPMFDSASDAPLRRVIRAPVPSAARCNIIYSTRAVVESHHPLIEVCGVGGPVTCRLTPQLVLRPVSHSCVVACVGCLCLAQWRTCI